MSVPLKSQWIAFNTIFRREIRRFMRIWLQTLVPPAITMALYFIIFGNLVGSRIGQMSGFSYMQFVVPGLIMMSVITNAYANVVSSFFGAKFQHFIDEMLVAPVPNYVILLGFVLGGVCRGLAVGAIVTGLSLFFTDLHIEHVWIMLSMLVLTAFLFSLAGFINAVFASKFDDISIVPTFVLTPLIYLGGVFYSLDLLSDFWAAAARLNPILHIVNTFRYGVLGVSDTNIVVAFAMVIIFNIVAFLYCMHLLKTSKRLRQ